MISVGSGGGDERGSKEAREVGITRRFSVIALAPFLITDNVCFHPSLLY